MRKRAEGKKNKDLTAPLFKKKFAQHNDTNGTHESEKSENHDKTRELTSVEPTKHERQYDHNGVKDIQQIQKFLTIGIHTQHDLDDEDSQNDQSCDVHPLKIPTFIVVVYLLISSDRVPVIMFERWVRYILDIQDYVHGKWKICNHEKKNN